MNKNEHICRCSETVPGACTTVEATEPNVHTSYKTEIDQTQKRWNRKENTS